MSKIRTASVLKAVCCCGCSCESVPSVPVDPCVLGVPCRSVVLCFLVFLVVPGVSCVPGVPGVSCVPVVPCVPVVFVADGQSSLGSCAETKSTVESSCHIAG